MLIACILVPYYCDTTGAAGIGDKIISFVHKVLKVLIISLLTEVDPIIITEMLECARVIVSELPLITLTSLTESSLCLVEWEVQSLQLFKVIMTRALGLQGGSKVYVQALDMERLANNVGRSSTMCVTWIRDICRDSPAPLFTLLLAVHESWLDPTQTSDGTGFARNFFASVGERCMIRSSNTSDARDMAFCSLLLILVNRYYAMPSRAVDSLTQQLEMRLPSLSRWLRHFADTAAASESFSCRLLSAQLTTEMIRKHGNPPSVGTYTIELKEFEDVVQDLQRMCEDTNHQVRGQALSALGALSTKQWSYLYNISNWTEQEGMKPLHTLILETLLDGCVDSVGTIKSVAYRSLGETLMNGALTIRASNAVKIFTQRILDVVSRGCKDSKLAVRLQAVWSLGNLILICLPHRNLHMPEHIALSRDDVYITDDAWLQAFQHCKVLCTQDSDKLLPSSARCIGFLAGGLRMTMQHRAVLYDILELLVTRRFELSCDDDIDLIQESTVHEHLEKMGPKLSFSICQSLGFVGKALKRGGMDELDVKMIELINLVLSVMLRRCRPKIQLQACKGMINMYRVDSSSNEIHKLSPPSLVGDRVILGKTIFLSLDAALIATTTISNEEISMKTTLNRSLKKATLVLIASILESFEQQMPESEEEMKKKILMVILHHIDGLMDWLERYMEEPSESLNISAFMISLPSWQPASLGAFIADGDESPPTISDSSMMSAQESSSTHEQIIRIAHTLNSIISDTSAGLEDEMEALLPRGAMSKLIWLVACDPSKLPTLSSLGSPVRSPSKLDDDEVKWEGYSVELDDEI